MQSGKQTGAGQLSRWGEVLMGAGVRLHLHELAWVFAGKGALLGANTLLMLILARHLSLEVYGLFATVVGAQLLISRILLAGLDGGAIRLGNLGGVSTREVEWAGAHILGRTAAGLLIVTVAAWPWLRYGAGQYWPAWAVVAVVLASIGLALIDFAYFCRLAELGYRAGAMVQGSPAAVRLLATAAAVYFLPGSAPVFLTYGVVSLIFGLWHMRKVVRNGAAGRPGLVLRVLKYSIWQGIANVTAALSLHQGTFFLAWFHARADTGIFGLALTISLGFFAVKNAFYEYLLPRMVRVESTPGLPVFLGRWMAAAAALAAGGVPVLVLVGKLLPRLTRPEMAAAVPVLYVLGASMLLLILQVPLEAASQYLLRPQFIVGSWVLRVAAMAGFSLTLGHNAVGVAVAQLAAGALAFAAIAVMVAVEIVRALRTGECRVLRAATETI